MSFFGRPQGRPRNMDFAPGPARNVQKPPKIALKVVGLFIK
jgi:hypothetical protein